MRFVELAFSLHVACPTTLAYRVLDWSVAGAWMLIPVRLRLAVACEGQALKSGKRCHSEGLGRRPCSPWQVAVARWSMQWEHRIGAGGCVRLIDFAGSRIGKRVQNAGRP